MPSSSAGIPRILLDRFFSAPIETSNDVASSVPAPANTPKVSEIPLPVKIAPVVPNAPAAVEPPKITVPEAEDRDSTCVKAMQLVAREAGLYVSDLLDERAFADLGIDSLMSLVIAEKFREQLGVTVTGSLFLEYPTVGDLRAWLIEYYN